MNLDCFVEYLLDWLDYSEPLEAMEITTGKETTDVSVQAYDGTVFSVRCKKEE